MAVALFEQTTGCGWVVETPRDGGGAWLFDVRFGDGGKLDPHPIVVDKQTGVATWVTRDEIVAGEKERQAQRNGYDRDAAQSTTIR